MSNSEAEIWRARAEKLQARVDELEAELADERKRWRVPKWAAELRRSLEKGLRYE